MRCAWCGAEAVAAGGTWAPSCAAKACGDASYALVIAIVRAAWRRVEPTPETLRAMYDFEDGRDARELRGEPPDMSGWVLW